MHIVEVYERLDGSEPSKTVEELEPLTAEHSFHLTSSVQRLASSVRALRDRNAFKEVHASFITKEILGVDNTERCVERSLPGGIGTITFAAPLAQAGGGVVELMGATSKGLDLRWTSPTDDVVLVERKDRSLDVSMRDTDAKRALRLTSTARAMQVPDTPNALRVVLVGFRHLVLKADQGPLDCVYQDTIVREFGNRPIEAHLPHIAIAEHLGFELKTGGSKNDFWSPQPIGSACDELDARFIRLIADACRGKKGVWPET